MFSPLHNSSEGVLRGPPREPGTAPEAEEWLCLSSPDGVEEGDCTIATCDGAGGCVLGDLPGGGSQTYPLCPRWHLAR